MNLLHIAHEEPSARLWSDRFIEQLTSLGDLHITENGGQLSEEALLERMRSADVLLTGWGSVAVPPALAREPGAVRYICHMTGTMRATVPLEVIEAGVPVTNWGDAPANQVAEGAMALLLGTLKDLHHHVVTKREGGWGIDVHRNGGSLRGLRVGVYGCGAVGRRFIEMLRPFRAEVLVFDPYEVALPEGCRRAETLEELFGSCSAVAIHAALTAETRRSVTAELLALLPDHGVLVNTARGDILDQEALFAELEAGRLRAGLDVLAGSDSLPRDHPARRWENLILTSHQVEWGWPDDYEPTSELLPLHEVCLANLRRFAAGEQLLHRMDRERYERST
jgi:phosphoglycerate dehydrogenase-like enzyme